MPNNQKKQHVYFISFLSFVRNFNFVLKEVLVSQVDVKRGFWRELIFLCILWLYSRWGSSFECSYDCFYSWHDGFKHYWYNVSSHFDHQYLVMYGGLKQKSLALYWMFKNSTESFHLFTVGKVVCCVHFRWRFSLGIRLKLLQSTFWFLSSWILKHFDTKCREVPFNDNLSSSLPISIF